MNESLVIAITGGIGTGKSTVSEMIAAKGLRVISSDNAAKELMVTDGELKKRIMAAFGDNFYLPDGTPDKELIASTVFGDSEESAKSLAKLNSIVHPRVIEQMIETVERYEKEGDRLIFVESALTYEAGLEEGFDYIIVVDAPEDVCIERVMKRSGLTVERVKQQINAQMPQSEKVAHADFVIDNSGGLEKLSQSVDFIVTILESMVPED